MKKDLIKLMLAFLVIFFSAVRAARANQAESLKHPMIVDASNDFRFETLSVGEKIYRDDISTDAILFDHISGDLGFFDQQNIRVVRTRMTDNLSSGNDALFKLRSEFHPNFAIAYNGTGKKSDLPGWLRNNFKESSVTIHTRRLKSLKRGPSFRVFEYTGNENEVTLGENGKASNMYFVIVRSGESFQLKR